MIGIYSFKNKINGKRYVGQSIQLEERTQKYHKNDPFNINNGCYNTKFYQAIRKYGYNNFEIEILEECSISDLDEKEIYWIEFYNTYKEGYNSTMGGQSTNYDILFSKEAKDKRILTLEQSKSLQGENHPRAKLTNEKVVDIRQRYKEGETVDQIWQDFKDLYKNKETFKNIVMGVTYKSVGNIPQIRHNQTGKLKFSKVEILNIRKLFDTNKMTVSQIAKKYGVAYNTISYIVKRKSYKNIE